MRVEFKVSLSETLGVNWEEFMTSMLETVKGDYYEHPGHAMAARMPWDDVDSPMYAIHDYIHGSDYIAENADMYLLLTKRTRPGYKVTTNAVSYASCRGNISWVKRIDEDTIIVGYNGTRHGLNLWRVGETLPERLASVKPFHYQTQEPSWLWFENQHDYEFA